MLRISALALTLGAVGAYAGAPVLITQAIDESKLATLEGNTHPAATAENDRGRVDDSLVLDHVLLLLKRSPEQEQALAKLLDQLHDPASPNYHKWLTPAQFGQQFGLAQQDRDTIRRWLESHGFTVNSTYKNGVMMDISGTAGQVREAFHTEFHNLLADGKAHIANMRDPQIPAALAPAIAGPMSLHDFRPVPLYQRPDYTASCFSTDTCNLVGPGDLQKIYGMKPLFRAKRTGKGQTVVLLEESDFYKQSDWTDFRTAFGLTRYKHGSLTTVHPAPASGKNNCTDPGVLGGAAFETAVDVEYSGSAAPDATIEVASCSDTKTTAGLVLALQNLLNAKTPPSIFSASYGYCETGLGAAGNAVFNTTYQQAATEGASVFVASGDTAASPFGCINEGSKAATVGIGVNGFASTPYNVAVGGTDFSDAYTGDTSTYWRSTNSPFLESALSYVPEVPWNDSCASALLTAYTGFTTPYGSAGLCNSSMAAKDGWLNIIGGGGGPSGCATGKSSNGAVVSGTCKGYPKPSWQSLVGNPSDGVRDLPDVSLFASNGFLFHYYPVCYSNTADKGDPGVPCTGAPNTWDGAGGTSFSAPIMAGIQALVNESHGKQGNPNPVYYALAAASYGASGNAACNSSLGNQVDRDCVFRDITSGDMDVPCTGAYNCYKPSGTYGVLSTSGTEYQPAYGTNVGWDFSTGIGSVNAAKLVTQWQTVAP